ncbi:hypothetical protein [Neolewinella agarilytica]|uniref:Uncharacterized protein n=1 Tax=Neolewinella agarilytica TaxID=478744 RepID=A0A1H9F0H4_9BACT|nr:hypothetical protein [Neolewinella agarilytica]SEQ31480.1 hypothetical protein SAMN05444359_10839 [Neolewinella agarilytica]
MPDISIRLKRLGKKRIHSVPYVITSEVSTLRELIRACVEKEVDRFNESREEPKVFAFLTPAEIQSQSQDGKVSFGELANQNKADQEQAIAVALQAHEDGVFCVFIDDDEIRSASDSITLQDGSIVTFLRLTFLTGTLW